MGRGFLRSGVWLLPALCATAWAAGTDLRLVDAARTDDVRRASELIQQHIDVNATQPDGATALHWAVQWNDETLVDRLLAAGAKVNSANDYGVTPIFLAATNGSASMIAKLLRAGASSNTALPTGVTVLMEAARTGNTAAVTTLLEAGANVNAKQVSKGQTALMWAVSERHRDVAQRLLNRGADIHARTDQGFTPL